MHFSFSFDQDMKVDKTLMQTLACQLSLTFMQLLFSFDWDTRVEKTVMQTLACQLSLTFMQLLFSFDWDTRVEKTLMQTLSSQLSSILVATFSLANFHSSYCSFPFEGNITSQIWPGCLVTHSLRLLLMTAKLPCQGYRLKERFRPSIFYPRYTIQHKTL